MQMPLQWILNKIAGDYNEKQLKKLGPVIDEINTLCEEWDALSDEQIQAKTPEFQERLQNWETTDDILVEAFATVKQACKRMMGQEIEIKGEKDTWKMVPYDVQILWGIVLHQSNIAEMRTWEGKTLVATMPAYLNALTGKWVHIVTVNDYLASRDAEWMGHLYEWLWLSVWSVIKKTPLKERKAEYSKDITYIENSELWFDYLRDNLAKSKEDRNVIWRPLHYAIIDEVDSILVDEARTPLIISQPSEEPTEKYQYYARLVQLLTPSKGKKKVSKWFLHELLKEMRHEEEIEDDGWHYYIEEKTKSVTLSSAWIEKLEELLKIDNLYRDLGYDEIHHIENALRAQAVYHRDKEYLVKDGQVMIVDDHTWRVMPGRRYSEGLHQAIEAKEQVQIQRESKTIASITYQHFFKQYQKLSWMTGTAATEAEEFEKIYSLEVITVPTNKPILRVDKNDMVYFNQDAKWKAVVEHISFYHKVWVPILIGTSSIHTSELVSSILRKMSLTHTVLNAKFHEQEAKIVANAWKKWSLVVATNMAWRGTDIKLDPSLLPDQAAGYAAYIKSQIWKGVGFGGVVYSSLEFDLLIEAMKETFSLTDEQVRQAEKWRQTVWDLTWKIVFNTSKNTKDQWFAEVRCKPATWGASETEEYDLHFGLFILGTEKHDSRRIDNQLRGRAWRQWDPGVSQFFVAMDDEIMRKMGWSKIQAAARMLLSKEDLEKMAFTQKQFTSSIARSQKQMEGYHFSIRKHLFDYDSVINKQRTRIYAKRDEILDLTDVTPEEGKIEKEAWVITLQVFEEVRYFIDEVVESLVKTYTAMSPWNLQELLETLQEITGVSLLEEEVSSIRSASKLEEVLTQQLHDSFESLVQDVDEERLNEYCKRVYLYVIDKNWMQHITDMQYLREKVWLYWYAQLDPLVIYKKEAFEKFQSMLFTIKKETLGQVFRTDFAWIQQAEKIAVQMQQQNKKVNMVDILKAVTAWLKVQPPQQWQKKTEHAHKTLETGEKAEVLEDSGDIEVLEIEDEWDGSNQTSLDVDTTNVKKKLRPNDRVNIQYSDGRTEYGVKWKKVKNEVESGQAELVG